MSGASQRHKCETRGFTVIEGPSKENGGYPDNCGPTPQPACSPRPVITDVEVDDNTGTAISVTFDQSTVGGEGISLRINGVKTATYTTTNIFGFMGAQIVGRCLLGDVVTLEYDPGDIAAENGNQCPMAPVQGVAVLNRSPTPACANPANITSAIVDPTGDLLTVELDRAVTGTTGFEIITNDQGYDLVSAGTNNGTNITFTGFPTVQSGDEVYIKVGSVSDVETVALPNCQIYPIGYYQAQNQST